MTDDIFHDTNILFYAYDLSEPSKREVCKTLVGNVFGGETKGFISNQILVELYIESFLASTNWLKIRYNHFTIKSALHISKTFGAPFLDSLIAETMKENGISSIITENERDFRRISGIQVPNPLKP